MHVYLQSISTKLILVAGDIAQKLKTLALAVEPGLVPRSHTVAQNNLCLQFQGIRDSFLNLKEHLAWIWYTFVHVGKALKDIK